MLGVCGGWFKNSTKPRAATRTFLDRIGFVPDAQQAAVLSSPNSRLLLACSRQWGKSTVAAVKAVERAYSVPRSLVLVASPSTRQSAEFLRKAEAFVQKIGVPIRGDGDNTVSVALPNGSRIVGIPGVEATVRGFSAVSLMIIDEAARVEDAVYKSLRPMLAVSGGDLWLLSTPYGKRGFFHDEWERGGDTWTRVAVPATECPRIGREFLEEEREALGAAWFAQEYLCEFVDCGATMFDRDVVERALRDDVLPLDLAA